VLTQTGTIAVSTLTDVENELPYMARLTQSQAVAQRMGYAQMIEGKDCKHLRGKQVTFRFGRQRLSIGDNVRIAVLEWTGAEDAVTSDVVNNWASAVYTAGNFFLGANLTVSGVVQQALLANTLTDGSWSPSTSARLQ
jgi:ABC-type Fe3+-siderophore transport system permease subunit